LLVPAWLDLLAGAADVGAGAGAEHGCDGLEELLLLEACSSEVERANVGRNIPQFFGRMAASSGGVTQTVVSERTSAI